MFTRWGEIVSRHGAIVLGAWVAILVAAYFASPSWDRLAANGTFAALPREMSSRRGAAILRRAFPNLDWQSEIVLVAARADGRLRPEDFVVAGRLAQDFTPASDPRGRIANVWTYHDPLVGDKLVSPAGPQGQAVLTLIHLRSDLISVDNLDIMQRTQRSMAAQRQDARLSAGLGTGHYRLGRRRHRYAPFRGRKRAEYPVDDRRPGCAHSIAGLPRQGLVVVPLLTIGASLGLSICILGLLAELSQRTAWFDFKLFQTIKIFLVVILFGATTDYCLFLTGRFREELEGGLDHRQAAQP